MEEEEIREKLRLLEDELNELKVKILPRNPNRFVRASRGINRWFSTYKPLLTLIGAALTLAYVQVIYKLDPLESYRSASTSKKLAEFYRGLGDKLLFNDNYKDAESAYKSSLALQPNNSRAIFGLAKVQVFDPPIGQKYTDPEAADVKLNYLISLFPDDADLYALKCVLSEARDSPEAKTWCEKAVHLNPTAFRVYIELGYICQKENDSEGAMKNTQKALELNPQSSLANNNLGYLELLKLDFEDAAKHLELANSISQKLETMLSLGDVYRYMGKTSDAEAMHEACFAVVSEKEVEQDSRTSGTWLENYLPLNKQDEETSKSAVRASTIDEKKVMVCYALAIDYALAGKFGPANKLFEEGRLDDKTKVFGRYFMTRCLTANNILSPGRETKLWLNKSSMKVCEDSEQCKLVDSFYR